MKIKIFPQIKQIDADRKPTKVSKISKKTQWEKKLCGKSARSAGE